MTVREELEREERSRLSPYACRSAETRGRMLPEEESDCRTAFQRDTDRITHSKAFRRLMHKTQVFLDPEGDHYRTRMTHTLEVTRIARTIARALRLNEDLVEAAGLGHDLGHTPFGHAGEKALGQAMGKPFRHNEQSIRIVDTLENGGRGLNLTDEVRSGILCHTGDTPANTLEGRIIKFADRIAYINHDIDDATRAGIITAESIPTAISEVLGTTHSVRINTLVENIILCSRDSREIAMEPRVLRAMEDLRDFMFENVYTSPVAKGEESKAKDMLLKLYTYYLERPEALPPDFQTQLDFEGIPRIVCDYIAGMTDKYAVRKYTELFIPSGWSLH